MDLPAVAGQRLQPGVVPGLGEEVLVLVAGADVAAVPVFVDADAVDARLAADAGQRVGNPAGVPLSVEAHAVAAVGADVARGCLAGLVVVLPERVHDAVLETMLAAELGVGVGEDRVGVEHRQVTRLPAILDMRPQCRETAPLRHVTVVVASVQRVHELARDRLLDPVGLVPSVERFAQFLLQPVHGHAPGALVAPGPPRHHLHYVVGREEVVGAVGAVFEQRSLPPSRRDDVPAIGQLRRIRPRRPRLV